MKASQQPEVADESSWIGSLGCIVILLLLLAFWCGVGSLIGIALGKSAARGGVVTLAVLGPLMVGLFVLGAFFAEYAKRSK